MLEEVVGPSDDDPDERDESNGLESDALNEVREVAQQEVRRAFELSFHAGPLPPAEEYGKYEQVEPGTARWIRDTTEREQRQRHHLERVGLYASIGVRYLGMLIAAGISILAILIGADLIRGGQDVSGLVFVLGGLAPIIAAFLFRKNLPRGPWSPSDSGGSDS